MCIFKEKTGYTSTISRLILKTIFDMTKTTKSSPVLQRNGVKNSFYSCSQLLTLLT